ncbi:alpha-L-fucosidase [Flavobacterium nackdongense]|uniref:alpha-L-fucosidase n=1 Tax=Flavobacterium nackdongense TaxID=2547394 RepID=A0A4P6YDM2_9FLAO|nr:alpha-L-fucosidase [Flavobacterium nackdongense]QBN18984.1 alpha-fucosidase [Flavobacterium nackdongense]
MRKNVLYRCLCCFTLLAIPANLDAQTTASKAASELKPLTNSDFETGDLTGWKHWRTKFCSISKDAYSGKYALQVGPERAFGVQEVKVKPNSLYRISAFVKTDSGAEEIQLKISDYGGASLSVSSALTAYTKVSLDFQTAFSSDNLLISFIHPTGNGSGFADQIELTYLGEAPAPKIQEFVKIPERILKEDVGVSQLPNEKMKWFLDDKFGMFIHWGVYAAMPEGSEWVRHTEAWGQEYYQRRARDPKKGFTAAKFDASQWADIAKKAGMKYMAMTSRHHDGFALFDSKHPSSWTSKKDLGRDLVKEYTDAVRASGLHVGLYYSPMSWRYPGYYDVTGKDCKPNVWGYKTAAWHKADAKDMKEEVYEQVTTLFNDYGKIDYMFWDGGWLSQTVNREVELAFWDPGKYQNPNNEWPINEKFITKEEGTNKPLGIMGLVRKFQPDLVVNERFSWVGDVHAEEGGSATSGDIRYEQYGEKCLSLQKGGWGYRPNGKVFSFEEVAVFLSNCVVRNINLLLNVAPDREGVIPQNQQEVLFQTGKWLSKVGDGIYGTRGGPWQPLFGEYGFTFKGNKIYCHIYEGYRDFKSGTFTTQSLANKKVTKVINLYDGKELLWTKNKNKTITIAGVDYSLNSAATLLEITLAEPVFK